MTLLWNIIERFCRLLYHITIGTKLNSSNLKYMVKNFIETIKYRHELDILGRLILLLNIFIYINIKRNYWYRYILYTVYINVYVTI